MEDAPSMAEKRCFFSAAEFHNCLVVAGGRRNGSTAYDSVECFDPISNRWQQILRLNQTRWYHQVVACNALLSAIGGMSFDTSNLQPLFLASVEKLRSLDKK